VLNGSKMYSSPVRVVTLVAVTVVDVANTVFITVVVAKQRGPSPSARFTCVSPTFVLGRVSMIGLKPLGEGTV
jgi:hypothetical protein